MSSTDHIYHRAAKRRGDKFDRSMTRGKLLGNNAQLFIFSSPEPKAQVSYCHSAPSVVRTSVVVRPSVRPSSVHLSVNFYIFNFFSRTARWILMKLGRDEVLMVPYKCCCFSARSAKGRGQNRSQGVPFFKKLLLQTGRLQRQTK